MEGSIRIELLSASVDCVGTRIGLTPRQVELLSAIARRTRPVSRAELAEEIWPDKDPELGCKVLDVSLHRLRRTLSPCNVVCRKPGGYALAENVETDIGELELLARCVRGVGVLGAAEAGMLREAFERLTRAVNWSATGGIPASLEARVRALVSEIGGRLAGNALRRGDFAEALSITDGLVALDPSDESAWEIAIRAHLARNDRGAAIRAFRSCAQGLSRELGLQPSSHMIRLLDDPQVKQTYLVA